MLQDIGGAVFVEVASAVHLPVNTINPDGDIRLHRVVVHHHHFKSAVTACVPMHQDVAGAIVVEVGGGIHDPIRSAHGDLGLSLYPTRAHLIDQKLPRRGGRIINVDEWVGYPVSIEISGADESLVATDRAKYRRSPVSLDRLELPHGAVPRKDFPDQ